MNVNEFTCTQKKPDKYLRHILFWVMLYSPLLGLSLLVFVDDNTMMNLHWQKTVRWQMIYLSYFCVDICYTYIVAYYLIPRFLNTKKYSGFTWRLLLLSILSYCVTGAIMMWYIRDYKQSWVLNIWTHTQVFLPAGSFIHCGFFLFVKQLKNYYHTMEEKISLVRENGNAELQLLKAQVHPHFLFNTLNNIYSFTLKGSPIAGQLISKLSATLNYMVNDCDTAVVALDKELKMLNDYTSLEKVRYGNRLEFEMNIAGEAKNKFVTPLLMIPFVENAFKHGTSKMLENPWVKISVIINEGSLHFFVSNSKPAGALPNHGKSGLGLKNVRKRLELLYPGHYLLTIEASDTTFTANMTIPLQVDEAGQWHSGNGETSSSLLNVLHERN